MIKASAAYPACCAETDTSWATSPASAGNAPTNTNTVPITAAATCLEKSVVRVMTAPPGEYGREKGWACACLYIGSEYQTYVCLCVTDWGGPKRLAQVPLPW